MVLGSNRRSFPHLRQMVRDTRLAQFVKPSAPRKASGRRERDSFSCLPSFAGSVLPSLSLGPADNRGGRSNRAAILWLIHGGTAPGYRVVAVNGESSVGLRNIFGEHSAVFLEQIERLLPINSFGLIIRSPRIDARLICPRGDVELGCLAKP